MQINFNSNKWLDTSPLRIVQGENMADLVIITGPRYIGNLDLADLQMVIRADSKEHETSAEATLETVSQAENIEITWEVTSDFTAISGLIDLTIIGYSNSGAVIKITSGGIKVKENSPAGQPPLQTWENILADVREYALQALQASAAAKNYSISAENSANQSIQAKTSAEASAAASKQSENKSAEHEANSQKWAEQAQQVSQGSVGYFVTPQALKLAYPTASDGNWAIIGSTDTIWVWDSDTNEWLNSGQRIDLTEYYTKEQVDELLSAYGKLKTVNGKSPDPFGNADTYPTGGTAGQVLVKTVSGEEWADVDGLPDGGTTGQVLTKKSNANGDIGWQTPPTSAGDMTKAEYGGSAPGIVKITDNALALDGHAPDYFATAQALSDLLTALENQNTYSTTEQWTGEYWVDGKKIYRKTLVLSNVTGGSKTIAHGVSNMGSYRVFDFAGSYYIGSNSAIPVVDLRPNVSDRAHYESGLFTIDPVNISFYKATRTDQGTITAYITIRYTCTDR